MHRIDTPTAQKDKFGAGKNGFTRGNPQTGTPATDLDDDYFDSIQEELAAIVEASDAVLDKSKRNQVLTAMKALLLSREHPFADIKADGAAAVAEALSNLGLKSAAQRDVGTGTNQIPDMASFAAGPGWMKFPSGKIIQYGYQTSGASGAIIVNFPIPFPTQCYGVTGAGTDANAANIAGCQVIDKAGFNLSAWLVAANSVFNRTATNISWIAVGI
ncbi:gp53-like domain-containing protein [Citrobacter freundii]